MSNNDVMRSFRVKALKNFYCRQRNYLMLPAVMIFLVLLPQQRAHAQCSAISSIDFAAHNPESADIYWGDGSNTFVIESLEPQDYVCFDVVPFFVQLRIDPSALCQDYEVELPLQWLCNTTGQGGIGVSQVVSYQINPASDPGSVGLDGDESVSLFSETITGDPLDTPNGKCTLDAVFRVTGLDPGDVVIVRVDVLLDCDLSSTPTGNIQASLGEFAPIKILSGTGSNCGCDNLQGGAQTIPWKVGLPECEIDCSISKTDVSCNGGSNGSATVNVTGAAGTVSYLWSTGAQTQSVNNLSAGTYFVTVSDELPDCESVCSVTITQPGPLTINCSASPVTCDDDDGSSDDGSVNLNVTASGAGGLSYAWSNGATTEDISGLAPGTYTVTVTDDNDCTATCSATVLAANPLTIECEATDVTCNDQSGSSNDGSVDLTVTSSGAGGLSYAWSNGATTEDISGLAPGTYTVTVTDENDCTAVCSATVNPASSLNISCSASPVSCDDDDGSSDDGSVDLTIISGGAGGLSYAWSNGATTEDISGLAPGTYTVTVTDDNDCTATCSATVLAANPLTIECEATDVTCDDDDGSSDDGTVDLTVNSNGAGGLSYAWSNGATTEDISGLAPGTYTVTVTDDNDCTAVCSATVGAANPLTIECEATDVTCNDQNGSSDDGSVDLTVNSNGAGGLSYAWSNGATTEDISGLAPGTYTVTVTDENDCTAVCSATVMAAPRLSCSITNNSGVSEICLGETISLSANVVGGTPSYDYLWSSSAGGTIFSPSNTSSSVNVSNLPLGTATITLRITDSYGCVTTCTISITSVRCVDECTWTPGFWKNHPEEICGLLGGSVSRVKGNKTCTGDSRNIGFILCGEHYTLSAADISCLFDYSGSTRGNKLPPGCSADVVAIAQYFAAYPNGETLLHHILAAKLNLMYNGAGFGNIDIGDLVCIDQVNGVNIPDIFNGTPDAGANEICAIDFCLGSGASASTLSSYIKPLTAFNECNNTCGLPSQSDFSMSSYDPFATQRMNQDLQLFPNPAQDRLNIRFQLEEGVQMQLRLLDLNGRTYQFQQIEGIKGWNSQEIDLSELADGLYILQLTDGANAQTRRFVKTTK